jgi:hypothetical protein
MKKFAHQFKGFGNCDSACNVYVTEEEGTTHICFEDIGVGTSVTNASEIIATEIVKKYNFNPQNCKFYETYEDSGEIDGIEYTWVNGKASAPRWHPEDPIKRLLFAF